MLPHGAMRFARDEWMGVMGRMGVMGVMKKQGHVNALSGYKMMGRQNDKRHASRHRFAEVVTREQFELTALLRAKHQVLNMKQTSVRRHTV